MAKPELSPSIGQFVLPNPLPENQNEWLESNFIPRDLKLPMSPNCISFERIALERLCKRPLITDLVFSKVSLPKKDGTGQEATLGVAGAKDTATQLGEEEKILFGNKLLTPDHTVTIPREFKKGASIGLIKIPLLKSAEIKMPRVKGKTFEKMLETLQDFAGHPMLNYSLTVGYDKNDFEPFWAMDACKFIAFYPIMLEFDLVRLTEDHQTLVLTDNYTSLVETFLAVPVDGSGNLLLDEPGVVSPNAWPPRYIR